MIKDTSIAENSTLRIPRARFALPAGRDIPTAWTVAAEPA